MTFFEVTRQLADALSRRRERAIRAACTWRGVNPDEVKTRCVLEHTQQGGLDVLRIDGEAVLNIYPPQYELEERAGGEIKIRAWQEIRKTT